MSAYPVLYGLAGVLSALTVLTIVTLKVATSGPDTLAVPLPLLPSLSLVPFGRFVTVEDFYFVLFASVINFDYIVGSVYSMIGFVLYATVFPAIIARRLLGLGLDAIPRGIEFFIAFLTDVSRKLGLEQLTSVLSRAVPVPRIQVAGRDTTGVPGWRKKRRLPARWVLPVVMEPWRVRKGRRERGRMMGECGRFFSALEYFR
jgi:hypothetical protein